MPSSTGRWKRVAVLGNGPAPRWLAQKAAGCGYAVLQHSLAAGASFAEPGVAWAATIEEAVRDADAVVDFVPDELESKLEIFTLLDRMAPPRTVLMTPVERLSIRDLASCTYRAGKCLAVKPFMVPPHEGWVVEIISPPEAEDEVVEQAQWFWAALGAGVTVIEDCSALP